jgi:uncharacterized surface anchored protein
VTTALALQAETTGTIMARVVDQSGNSVAGATAQMEPADGKIMAKAIPRCLTDETGVCSYAHLQFGKYHVTAMKNADGYPDVSGELYGHGKSELIAEVTPDAPTASVSITLGPRAGAITLKIVDDATGLPVANPTVTLSLATTPTTFRTSSLHSDFKILIPPDEDILVEVSSDGYKPWHMETQPEATHANALHLHSGEAREFTIRLQPK